MRTILIILGVILALGVIAYFVFPKFQSTIKKAFAGLLIVIGGWFGVNQVEDTVIDPIDDGIEQATKDTIHWNRSLSYDEAEVTFEDQEMLDAVILYAFDENNINIEGEFIERSKVNWGTIPKSYSALFENEDHFIKINIIIRLKPEPIDSDNDGFIDNLDDCPAEFGSDNGCPEITYKEVKETQDIPFSFSTTNIKSEARKGKNGVLTITYKLTFKDGEQVDKEKLSEKITKQPRSEIKYVEPEPEPEPSEYKTVHLNIPSGQDEITKYLRGQFKQDSAIYKFPAGEFYTKGVLESDRVYNFHFKSEYKKNNVIIPIDTIVPIRTGDNGIVRLENRKHVLLEGEGSEKSMLYTLEPAVWDGDIDGDGISDGDYPSTHPYLSQRKFFYLIDSDYISIKNIGAKSTNFSPVHKEGRPEYDSHYEFEHLVHGESVDHLYLENLYGGGLWGDGIYLRDCNDVYLKDIYINWNGRQGGAAISGNRVYIENYTVVNSIRAGFDIEGNVADEVAENFVITYSKFNTHLIGLPMGGPGFVKNVLSINNEYYGTPIWSRGDGKTRLRENIMFVNNKAEQLGTYRHTNNILIDGIEQDELDYNKIAIGDFSNCTNITIRNINLPNYGRLGKSNEPFPIVTTKNTPVNEFKFYNNKQKIGVANTDISIRADKIEPGNWYYVQEFGYAQLSNLDSIVPTFSRVLKPTRKATALDFQYREEYDSKEQALERGVRNGSLCRIGNAVYKYKGNGEFKELTVESLPMLHPVSIPDDYIPTEEEKKSIPFETSKWMEFQWERLYINGKGWKDENYEDDGWRPQWYNELKNAA